MIDLLNISLQFGGKFLFNGVNYKINAGDKISLVGANGTGKSSLLKILTGQLQPESGKIIKQKNVQVGYLPQDHVTHSGKSLIQEATSALTDIIKLQQKEKEITGQLVSSLLTDEQREDLVNQLGEVHHRLEELDSYSAEARVKKILLGLGFTRDEFEKLTDEFSGGWQMRIALAKILISQNDMLLMDEPTNHLDIDSLEWLIDYLKSFRGALLIVSHDKRFVNEITNRTLEIFSGKINSFRGNYDAYLKFKDERDVMLEHQFDLQQKKIKETESFIERFRYKATKAKQVQSRIKQLEKVELVELPEGTASINIRFPAPPPSGRINVELKNIKKAYGSNLVFNGLNFIVERGEKIAFVGPNGAGKSTLAKIIASVINFDEGERVLGYNTLVSYYAQDVADELNPEYDIIETVEGLAEDKSIGQLRSLLGSFLFSGDDVFKKVGVLSGGEKSRVALVKILLTKSNFIILDEPTNHLDVSSKEVLQQALINFAGSLILVSHDVDFLKPIVNKVVEIRKGNVQTFLGGMDYYLSKRSEILEREEAVKDQVGDTGLTKKDQKRIEAEKRQKRYQVTKDIISKIAGLEKKIEETESKVKEIESLLAEPSTYGNAAVAKEKNLEYVQVKELLNSLMEEWEQLSVKLTNIEKQFD